jgi:hypothetical protein
MECPSLEDEEIGAPQTVAPHHLPYEVPQPDHSTAAGKQWTRKRPKTTADRQWEEARRSARLRQMLSNSPSSEDEDEGEEQYGRSTESGRWMLESCEPP